MAQQPTIVIVTGASGNVGRAMVARLAQEQARIAAVERGGKGEPDSPPCTWHRGIDLEDPAAAVAVVDATLRQHGRIDGVVHTVGGFAHAAIADSDTVLFERMFRLNVLTTLNMLRAAVPPMRAARRGSLVAISAGTALRAPAGLSAYACAKAGVLRLVESFADELKAEAVRVNAILPSIIDTPQNRADMPKADHSRWVGPDQVAEVAAFLLSDRSAALTGAAILASGRV